MQPCPLCASTLHGKHCARHYGDLSEACPLGLPRAPGAVHVAKAPLSMAETEFEAYDDVLAMRSLGPEKVAEAWEDGDALVIEWRGVDIRAMTTDELRRAFRELFLIAAGNTATGFHRWGTAMTRQGLGRTYRPCEGGEPDAA